MKHSGEGAGHTRDERPSWDAVAAGWRKHQGRIEPAARDLNERLIRRAAITDGHRVLDVATGQGEPALTAARRVGPTGRVTATDFSSGMLDEARDRARAAGLTNLDFLERDAQALDFDAGTFDAATCRWGLMLIEDPAAALEGIRRSLKTGGILAAAVWGPADRVPFLTLPRAVAAREVGLPPFPEPGLEAPPHPLRLARRGMLEDLFREAGFADVHGESVEVTFRFPSPLDYVEMVRDMSFSMRQALAEQADEASERVWSGIAAELEPYVGAEGQVVLTNLARCVWGRCPAGG